jgi:HD-GYP domain-containing protein (c-di-GMP phosphodiesterase class II)
MLMNMRDAADDLIAHEVVQAADFDAQKAHVMAWIDECWEMLYLGEGSRFLNKNYDDVIDYMFSDLKESEKTCDFLKEAIRGHLNDKDLKDFRNFAMGKVVNNQKWHDEFAVEHERRQAELRAAAEYY